MFNHNYKVCITLFVDSQFSYRIASMYFVSVNGEFVYRSVLN
jgi:hypothetical protein